ncbi:MAG: Fe-S cluster assembly ATPase SufC [Gammaproteobacteria bacterium]
MKLEVKHLHVSINGKAILKGVDLTINAGEVHAIMGPNGSGKSTLSYVLAGRPGYEITEGEIWLNGEPIHTLAPNERAQKGVFLAMQYPVEIPGVSNVNFLKTALNAKRKAQGLPDMDAIDFLSSVKQKLKQVDMPESLLYRNVNEGFSGGEKKRNEILQMLVLNPALSILDEIDSGLDIDALQSVANGVNSMRNGEGMFLLVTHYQRLLSYIVPDYVHVFAQGKIVRSGDKSLALELEERGYAWIDEVPA